MVILSTASKLDRINCIGHF